jgi:GNAT superfamily N-acetyltransferase
MPLLQADSKKDAFDHYNVSKTLELMFLGVSRHHRGLGIGRLLAEATCKVAASKNIPVVTAIFTSIGSQTIGKRLEWDQLFTIPMSEFVYNGRPYSDFTGENQSMILMGKKTM